MGTTTGIEWTHHTFNPWRGCTKVHAGCAHCYAETLSARNPKALGMWGKDGDRVIAAHSYWQLPRTWDRQAREAGEIRRVFCASLADVFEGVNSMPSSSWTSVRLARTRLWDIIDTTPNLLWLLLTKRPHNIIDMVPRHWLARWPGNVMTGTSPCDQATADRCIPELLRVPGRHFLSIEPLIGEIDLLNADRDGLRGGMRGGIHWIIVGGESGSKARPMHPDWVRAIRDACQLGGIPFFFKQWGEFVPYEIDGDGMLAGQHGHWMDRHHLPHDLTDRVDELADGWLLDASMQLYRRVGKKLAGRMLDAGEHSEVPA